MGAERPTYEELEKQRNELDNKNKGLVGLLKTNLSQIQDNKEQISLLQGLKRKHEAEIDTQNKVLAERERKLQRTEKDLSTATRERTQALQQAAAGRAAAERAERTERAAEAERSQLGMIKSQLGQLQASVAKLEQQGRAAAVERADLFSKGVQHSNQLQKLKQAVSVQPAGQVPAQLPACASCQTLTEQVKRLEVIVADLLPLSESRAQAEEPGAVAALRAEVAQLRAQQGQALEDMQRWRTAMGSLAMLAGGPAPAPAAATQPHNQIYPPVPAGRLSLPSPAEMQAGSPAEGFHRGAEGGAPAGSQHSGSSAGKRKQPEQPAGSPPGRPQIEAEASPKAAKAARRGPPPPPPRFPASAPPPPAAASVGVTPPSPAPPPQPSPQPTPRAQASETADQPVDADPMEVVEMQLERLMQPGGPAAGDAADVAAALAACLVGRGCPLEFLLTCFESVLLETTGRRGFGEGTAGASAADGGRRPSSGGGTAVSAAPRLLPGMEALAQMARAQHAPPGGPALSGERRGSLPGFSSGGRSGAAPLTTNGGTPTSVTVPAASGTAAAGSGGGAPEESSFAETWCDEEARTHRRLSWLVSCAVSLDELCKGDSDAYLVLGDVGFLHHLRGHLQKCIVGSMGGEDGRLPIELCPLAAAAGVICRVLGDVQALRVMIFELAAAAVFHRKLHSLAVISAAIEAWPEALPGLDPDADPDADADNPLCTILHEVLQGLCETALAGAGAEPELTAAAAVQLLALGQAWWGWADSSGDGGQAAGGGGVAARVRQTAPTLKAVLGRLADASETPEGWADPDAMEDRWETLSLAMQLATGAGGWQFGYQELICAQLIGILQTATSNSPVQQVVLDVIADVACAVLRSPSRIANGAMAKVCRVLVEQHLGSSPEWKPADDPSDDAVQVCAARAVLRVAAAAKVPPPALGAPAEAAASGALKDCAPDPWDVASEARLWIDERRHRRLP